MKRICIICLGLSLSGCGYKPLLKPAIVPANAAYQKDMERMPTVVFIGDDVVANWPLTATSPLWINKGVAQETSDKTLARFQKDVIDLHPDIVYIQTGTWDCVASNTPPLSPGQSNPLTNLGSMYQIATDSKIKVIIGRPLPIGPGDLADQLKAESPAYPGCMFSYLDRNMTLTQYDGFEFQDAVLLEYDVVLAGQAGQAVWKTVNGIDPDADGYAAMTPLVLDAVRSFDVGGIR